MGLSRTKIEQLKKEFGISNQPPVPSGSVKNYNEVRSLYKKMANASVTPNKIITDAHGFTIGSHVGITKQFTGIDKVFYTLVQGVMEDPDFALQKDPAIYDKMMRDPQIFYCLELRKNAVASLPWTIKPARGKETEPAAVHFAEMTEQRLRQIPHFNKLLHAILDAFLPGLSANELVWKRDKEKGVYVIAEHFPIDKSRLKFDSKGNPRLLSPNNPTRGIPFPPYKIITHVFNAVDGTWRHPERIAHRYYGRGLADTPLYHYFYFKMLALKYLMKYLERHGIPFKVLYSGAQNEALASQLSSMMAALKNDSTVFLPGKKGDMNVDIMEMSGRSQSVFMDFINYLDRLITKVILGQELMTEMPTIGSYAAAQVHKTVFELISSTDRTALRDTLNRTLIAYDMQLNYPSVSPEYYPTFEFKKAAVEDIGGFLSSVQQAINLGLTVSETQIREYTGLRAPTENEPAIDAGTLRQMEQPQQPQQPQQIQQPPNNNENDNNKGESKNGKKT